MAELHERELQGGLNMKRAWIIGLAVLLAAAWLAGSPDKSEAKGAALIVETKGDVKVQRGGKQKAVKGKFPLEWGDKVIVSGGSATVLYGSGKKVVVKSSHEITEANAKVEGKAGSKAASAVVASASSDLKAKDGLGGVTRAAGDAPELTVLAYNNTATTQTRPVFAWEAPEKTVSVTFTLYDENFEEIWSVKTDKNVLAWPEDKEPLAQGAEYTFMVSADVDGTPVDKDGSFQILDKETSEEILATVEAIKTDYSAEDDMAIQRLLLAQYFKENEMYMDAADQLKAMIALDENDLYAWNELALIYKQTGMKSKLEEALAKITAIEEKFGAQDDTF